ncbi:phage head spike fiber domain-containing protein [Pseudomonas sp.]|uniref:phage head spike fiber domain-containing protein n=1 Tax=Pseudomonas sp. TaxID=306 RepID=UPI002EDA9494
MGLVQRNAAEIIDVSRASTATYINASGLLATAAAGELRIDHDPLTLAVKGLLVEQGATNLLPYNSQLDQSVWTLSSASATANAAIAPDGTMTADKLVEASTTTAASHYTDRVVSGANTLGTQFTYSVYLKAAGRGFGRLTAYYDSGGAGGYTAIFNLNTGVVSAVASGLTATITPAPNGYYRCSITVTVDQTSYAKILYRIHIYSTATVGSYIGDGASGLYVWGAQAEAGNVATSVIATGSAAVTRAADAIGMLTSKTVARTNLVAPSNDFTGWTTSGGAVVASAARAGPNGLADTVSLPAGASISLPVAALVATDYCLSVFAQAESGTPALALSGTPYTVTAQALFDLAAGEVTGTTDSADLVPTLKGWVRLSLWAAADAAGTGTLTISNPSASTLTLGLWGVQLEASPVVTPLIKTTTAAASASDYFDWYSASEGTLVGAFPSTWGATLLSLDDGTDGFRIRQDATGAVLFEILADGATQATITGAVVAAAADLYVAACWKRTANGMKVALAVNGVVSTSALWLRFHFALPTTLWIGSSAGASGFLNGCARRARYFKGAQFDSLASLASES